MRGDQPTEPFARGAVAVNFGSGTMLGVGLFSGVINILALTGSLYMLQIYDRVLPSRSVPTLVGITILMTSLYAANALLDLIRVRVMTRVGVRIDNAAREQVFAAIQDQSLKQRQGMAGLQPVRDLDQIRGFLSGLGPTALFDLPWVPVYLAVVYLLHPLLGMFAALGALLLVYMTAHAEAKSRRPLENAAKSASERMAYGEAARRNAEVARAMGIMPHMQRRWAAINAAHLGDQLEAADAVSGMSVLSRAVRLLLQSGILGLGAYLVIHDNLSAGTIIAASIIMSRALAPIETAIAHWRGFVSARQSHRRLKQLFSEIDAKRCGGMLALPSPRASLVVDGLTMGPPGTTLPVLQNVAFALQAGEGLGVVGPSASGKSTLARALVGIWPAMQNGGSVRLDGAALDQWSPEVLGRHIGYLPQGIELLAGTIAENIARFDEAASSEAVVAAARSAGVHDMIVHLPQGYQTQVGDCGARLSAGQRQRIALACALFGDPFLVVLDEPNSNLDQVGEAALTEAILSVRRRGGIVVVIAHRPSALAAVEKVMTLASGRVQAFGPKDEVLRKLLQPPQRPAESTLSAAGGQSAGVTALRIVPDPHRGPAG